MAIQIALGLLLFFVFGPIILYFGLTLFVGTLKLILTPLLIFEAYCSKIVKWCNASLQKNKFLRGAVRKLESPMKKYIETPLTGTIQILTSHKTERTFWISCIMGLVLLICYYRFFKG